MSFSIGTWVCAPPLQSSRNRSPGQHGLITKNNLDAWWTTMMTNIWMLYGTNNALLLFFLYLVCNKWIMTFFSSRHNMTPWLNRSKNRIVSFLINRLYYLLFVALFSYYSVSLANLNPPRLQCHFVCYFFCRVYSIHFSTKWLIHSAE